MTRQNPRVLSIRRAHNGRQPLVVDNILQDADDNLARLLKHHLVAPRRIHLSEIGRDTVVLAYEERVNADEAEVVARATLAGQETLLRSARLGRGQGRKRLGGREALGRAQLTVLSGAQERVAVGVHAVDLGTIDVRRQCI